jgi:hypothetical protein
MRCGITPGITLGITSGMAIESDSGIVSKPVEKVVGRLTLLQGISQVLSHRKTVL